MAAEQVPSLGVPVGQPLPANTPPDIRGFQEEMRKAADEAVQRARRGCRQAREEETRNFDSLLELSVHQATARVGDAIKVA